ncbi:MAG: putative lipid II flippase FtsW [Patescibacteria group bacterium]
MKRYGSPDYVIIAVIGLLVIFGLIMLASASSNLGQTRFNDPFFYLKHQIFYGLSLGIIGFLVAWKIPYRWYQKTSVFLLLASVVLLFLVFTPLGLNSGNAERWLQLGPITFQPSELLKITLILYLAAWLSRSQERSQSLTKGFLPLLLVVALISVLLLKQPTTSITVILLGVAFIMYFASGAKLKFMGIMGILVAVIVTAAILITPYRLNRVVYFLNPDANLESGGYHRNQALIAIGSGNLLGVGYGQSTTKIGYLPEPIGDSIFAVIGEELGFVGAIFLISLFALLITRIFILAKKTGDRFAKLSLIGFGTLIAVQSFMNMAAISGLIPLTGVPLPFISYGGTALAVFMTIGGIVTNISKNS